MRYYCKSEWETFTVPQQDSNENLQHQLLSQHVTLIPDEGHWRYLIP